MIQKIEDLYVKSDPFIKEFDIFCNVNGLINKVKADHVCVKCSTSEIYENTRKHFEFDSRFMYQSLIPGRRIAFIGLSKSLYTAVGEIKYLELSDQKKDNSQGDRIDHIEIVPVTLTYEELVSFLKEKGNEVKEIIRPHHTTHDVYMKSGFIVRLSRELLVETIKRDGMV
ncbi:MAG: hypothetical protein JWN37_328 [Candidatus Nomurabacteria bacterium]|nr:hypothetical protein [Candidatus Nomurabacteria bacterium]